MKKVFSEALKWYVSKAKREGRETALKDKKGRNLELRLKKLRPKSEFPEVLQSWEEGFREGWLQRKAA